MHEIFKGIEVVVFDVMGVILSNPSLVKNGLFPIYKEKYSYEYIKKLYEDVKSNPDGDSSLWYGLGEPDHKQARERFLNNYELSEGFMKFRIFLKDNGFKMAILSNMPQDWGRYFYKKFNLSDDFDPMVFSGKIGVSKPDFGIYVEFLKRSGINSSKILFVDDKLENLKNASEVGMKTVHFDRKQEKSETDFSPDITISGFLELMQ